MAEQNLPLAEPQVKGGFPISPIWLVPIVAVLIGGWLVYQTLDKRGPKVTISFESADGIEEGKTKVKYRDVQVGLIENVQIKQDLTGVVITAEMKKESAPFLTDQTRFWVVRPRIDARGVSGLGTLVSGAYVEIDPGRSGDPQRDFIGLEDPPVITTDEPGKEFILVTEKLGSYVTGSPIYYRGLEVGEVLGHELQENRKEFWVHVFVHAPHDQLVRDDTRFWNASGIHASLSAEGMELQVESLQALALGGVAFDTPSEIDAGTPSAAGTQFRLHDTEEAVEEAAFTQKFRWILYFDGSVRGLTEGAPVEFKGIKIGNVVDVNLEMDRSITGYRIPVLVDIEPERVSVVGEGTVGRTISRDAHVKTMQAFVDAGLRARLKTGSLLTGQLLVDLDFHPDENPVFRGDGNYPEIPTIPSSIEEISRSVTALLDKIQSLPLDELTASLTNTVKSVESLVGSDEVKGALRSIERTLATLDRVMANVDKELTPEAHAALSEAHQTMKTVRESIASGSPLRYDLETTLQELAAAARSIRLLAEYLESNPNALIYGKGGRPQQ